MKLSSATAHQTGTFFTLCVMHYQMRSLPFSDGEMGRNRRVGSGCCLKLASSREAMISHCPPEFW
ncbi:hypothetical protein [Moorena sp. SIO4A5]|uniref:hypothetical protein n=1 Tax=Moorena sp. SIO4A5 TaxID=2607838 RepID=UPI0013C8C8D0|nr:hypothetical protein [Moorena sp. SIO4A5]NEO25195.1 hypothetical protein [Moorena sp. SIO4A5]